MLLTYSGNRYIVVLGRVIQYLSGEGTFPGPQLRTNHTPGFILLFWFIHNGGCFDLFQWQFGSLGGIG